MVSREPLRQPLGRLVQLSGIRIQIRPSPEQRRTADRQEPVQTHTESAELLFRSNRAQDTGSTDAEPAPGGRDAGTMSEEIPIGPNPCYQCGGEYGEHSNTCSKSPQNIRLKRIAEICQSIKPASDADDEPREVSEELAQIYKLAIGEL